MNSFRAFLVKQDLQNTAGATSTGRMKTGGTILILSPAVKPVMPAYLSGS